MTKEKLLVQIGLAIHSAIDEKPERRELLVAAIRDVKRFLFLGEKASYFYTYDEPDGSAVEVIEKEMRLFRIHCSELEGYLSALGEEPEVAATTKMGEPEVAATTKMEEPLNAVAAMLPDEPRFDLARKLFQSLERHEPTGKLIWSYRQSDLKSVINAISSRSELSESNVCAVANFVWKNGKGIKRKRFGSVRAIEKGMNLRIVAVISAIEEP